MLARVDDACHWTTEHLHAHTRFPEQALHVHWSKNCNKERDAPWQTMLGAMNTYYCVMINIGIWLEVLLAIAGVGLNPHVFGFADDFVGGDKRNESESCESLSYHSPPSIGIGDANRRPAHSSC